IVCVNQLFAALSAANYTHAHHRPTYSAFPLHPAVAYYDVLGDSPAWLRVVTPPGTGPSGIADHGRPPSPRAAHGVLSTTLRQQLQLALDLGQALHVDANVHASTPAPTTCPMPMAEARRGNTRSGNPYSGRRSAGPS